MGPIDGRPRHNTVHIVAVRDAIVLVEAVLAGIPFRLKLRLTVSSPPLPKATGNCRLEADDIASCSKTVFFTNRDVSLSLLDGWAYLIRKKW